MSEEIVKLLVRLGQTWNAGDAAGYADLFTADADYVTWFGLHMRGRQAIEDSHRELFATTSIKLPEGAQPQIRFLSDDVALVISDGASVVSFTAVRAREGWRFASFQNTRVSTP